MSANHHFIAHAEHGRWFVLDTYSGPAGREQGGGGGALAAGPYDQAADARAEAEALNGAAFVAAQGRPCGVSGTPVARSARPSNEDGQEAGARFRQRP